MKRVKIAVFFLTAAFAAAACVGCSKAETEKETETAGMEQTTEENTVGEEKGEETAAPEDGPQEYVHFTGGTLYEEGEYLFRIDSMEMTEEGYEILYSAQSDYAGYSAYYEMNVVVNGVHTSFEGIRFYNDTEEGQKGSSQMLGSTETPARMVIQKEYLEALGASEITSLHLNVELGRREQNTIKTGAELEYILYPGEAVQETDIFPEPARESWVLMDNEYGRVQILSAEYTANSNGYAQVHGYILAQGAGGEDFPKYGYKVQVRRMEGNRYRFGDWQNQSYTLQPEPWLYEVSIYDADLSFAECEEGFISTVNVEIDENVFSEEKVIDFTHLEYEE